MASISAVERVQGEVFTFNYQLLFPRPFPAWFRLRFWKKQKGSSSSVETAQNPVLQFIHYLPSFFLQTSFLLLELNFSFLLQYKACWADPFFTSKNLARSELNIYGLWPPDHDLPTRYRAYELLDGGTSQELSMSSSKCLEAGRAKEVNTLDFLIEQINCDSSS